LTLEHSRYTVQLGIEELSNRHGSALLIALCVAVSSSNLTASDEPQQIAVIVNAMVNQRPGDRFVEVDTRREDVAKDIEKALKKSSDLVLRKRKPEDPNVLRVLIVLGIKNVRITSLAELRPDLPSVGDQIVFVVDTEDTVMMFGTDASMKGDPYVRPVRATGPDQAAAAEVVAKDLIAWVDANRAKLLADNDRQ
jgi:hypothetical protein